jgi:formylglycine-generating enzyme required for sulfatase activity
MREFRLRGAWAAALLPAAFLGSFSLSAADEGEMELVRQLHRRISANKTALAAGEAYEVTIPDSSVTFRMTPIPSGKFAMGTPDSETGRGEDEGPRRRVQLDAFWMSSHEVTWDEYRIFMLRESSGYRDRDAAIAAVSSPTPPYVEMSFGMGIQGFPAISMTQHAAGKYAQWLSAKTGHFYRLPTEAEWEYACRAGTDTAYSFGDDKSQLGEHAWYSENSERHYQKIGTKQPNPWGLYDMHGNVWEWTLDQYKSAYPAANDPIANPLELADALYPRVARGGSWMDDADLSRCGARRASDESWKMQDPQLPKSIWYHTDAQWLGFRLVRPVKIPTPEEMYDAWNSATDKM